MSVIFYAEPNASLPYAVKCFCGALSPIEFASRLEAGEHSKMVECFEPNCGIIIVEPLVREPNLTISNHNASYVMEVLQLYPELDFEDKAYGSIAINEFSMLVENAIVNTQNEYILEKLEDLRGIIAWGRDNERSNIMWS